jgi:hypothetical protein
MVFTGIRAHIPPHESPIQVKPIASQGFSVPKTPGYMASRYTTEIPARFLLVYI